MQTDQDQPIQPVAESDDQSTSAMMRRRQLVLSGLGKGTAAAAVLLPLSSHATRDYVLKNAVLTTTSQNGYCSVSGFQSAAISLAPNAQVKTCTAPSPSTYATTTNVTSWKYNHNKGQADSARRDALALALASLSINNQAIEILDALSTVSNIGNPVVISGRLFQLTAFTASLDSGSSGKGSGSGTFREVVARNYPAAAVANGRVPNAVPLSSFPGLINNTLSSSVVAKSTVLWLLYADSKSDNACFAALALGCIAEDGFFTLADGYKNGNIPFDAAYVKKIYAEHVAGDVRVLPFVKAICPPG